MRTPLVLGAILVSICGCRARAPTPASADGAPAQPPTLTSARAPESPTTEARMREHDRHGAALRDAIARGDLDGAHREAKVLADWRIEGTIDATWRKNLNAMNFAAAHVEAARDIDAAARALGTLARTCGECHASLAGPHAVVGEPPTATEGATAEMRRHQWAAARLWDGLVVPSDDAWKAGTSVLADAPLEPEALTPQQSPAPRVGTLARAVHDRAHKAEAAASPFERARAYGELMTSCADCHHWLGGGPSAKPR